MPITSLYVPDSSPWITYQGAWKDSGLSTSHYADNSIHFTNSRDAKAFITFNGTGVQIFGSKTDDHGRYSVSLDGATAASFDGKGVGESFQTSLYSARNLPIGQHTVTITNLEEGRYLDIDYVSMDIGDGNAQTTSNEIAMDDSHDNITYSNFEKDPPGSANGDWYMNTLHKTSAANGTATIRFYGNAISLHGSTSDLHGLYGVTLDGGLQQRFNVASPETFRPKQLLYLASNLPQGPHQLELANLEEGKILDLDSANVTTYGDLPATASTTSIPSMKGTPTTRPEPHPKSMAAIAGGAAGAVVALVFVILLCLFLRRRHLRRQVDHFVARKEAAQVLDQELGTDPTSVTMVDYGASQRAGPHISSGGSPGAVTFGQLQHAAHGQRGKRDAYAQQQQNTISGGQRGDSSSAPNSLSASTFMAAAGPAPQQGTAPTPERIMEEEDMPPPNYARVFPGEPTPPSPILLSPVEMPIRGPPPAMAQTSGPAKSHPAWTARTPSAK